MKANPPCSLGLKAHIIGEVKAVGFDYGYTNVTHYCVGGVVARWWRVLLGPWPQALSPQGWIIGLVGVLGSSSAPPHPFRHLDTL